MTYHHIFPRPGIVLEALPEKLRLEACRILDRWRDDGLEQQGCCVPLRDHALLDDATVEKLRFSGFVVELDSNDHRESD